jgi:hypothetical protein
MTVDAATPHDSRFTRARRAFRGWRKTRPFWGGLLLILAGVEIFYSGNLNLGNIQIHLGLTGFKSYIIPLVVVLCGALIWATPAQRLFYGIIGTAATIYSIVSVNLGGFLIGVVLGVLGGALSIGWVPDKRPGPVAPDESDEAFEEYDEDATADYGDGIPADQPGDEEPEGEQRDPFRRPRHALNDDADYVLPEARTAPDEQTAGEPGPPEVATASRVRSIPDVASIREPIDGSAASEVADQRPSVPPDEGGRGGEGLRMLAIILVGLTLATLATAAVHAAPVAMAADCTPTPLQSAIQGAIDKKTGATANKPTADKPTADKSAGARHGQAALAPVGNDEPDPIASLAGGLIGGLFGIAPSAATDPSGAPSVSPTPSPAASITPPAAPVPSTTTTPGRPTTSVSPRPTTSASARPGRTTPTKRASEPSPAPSSSAPPCVVKPKALSAAGGQPTVNVKPSIQKTALLSMTGLSYDGNVALPTATGSIEAMQFSMSSSTSTPFELDVPVGSHQCTVKSSKLTVSGNVNFYTAEIKGNLLGLLPVDFTPSAPPPLTTPDLFFTDATLQLVFVRSDELTANAMTITSD